MGWYGGGMNSGTWLGMGVFWLALIGLIVWLVVRLLPGNASETTSATTSATSGSALEILDQRLAGGEIDLETWQAQRGALLASHSDRS